jgi:hypothetical protein
MKKTRAISLILAIITLLSVCGCGKANENRIEDIITLAKEVKISGKTVDTVEARMGAFEGKQGDYIEFFFSEKQTFNTIHITEKTTSIRQFNIYADVDGDYKLLYTGKHVLNEEIAVEETTTTAIKIHILNTEIGNDDFAITGINAYNIKESKGE